MSKIDWRHVIVGSMMGVVGLSIVGCAESSTGTREATGGMAMRSVDPESRAFKGTIISLRPTTSMMMISKDEKVGDQKIPNVVQVKWDAQTQFYLDNQPTTLDKIEQYMNVTVAGRMKDGEMVATEARFSSVLPANVRRAQN